MQPAVAEPLAMMRRARETFEVGSLVALAQTSGSSFGVLEEFVERGRHAGKVRVSRFGSSCVYAAPSQLFEGRRLQEKGIASCARQAQPPDDNGWSMSMATIAISSTEMLSPTAAETKRLKVGEAPDCTGFPADASKLRPDSHCAAAEDHAQDTKESAGSQSLLEDVARLTDVAMQSRDRASLVNAISTMEVLHMDVSEDARRILAEVEEEEMQSLWARAAEKNAQLDQCQKRDAPTGSSSAGSGTMPLLARLGEGRRTAGAYSRKRQCLVCFDDTDVAAGIECPNGSAHFLCNGCLSRHVEEDVTSENLPRFCQRGGVRCPGIGCTEETFGDQELASHLPMDAWQKYRAAKFRLEEQRIYAQAESDIKLRIKAEQERNQSLGSNEVEALRHQKNIVEDILTLRCPRCRQAFVDFLGCSVLKCSRARCSCEFCAWCLRDIRALNEIPHRHVRLCKHNISEDKSTSARKADFCRAHRHRRTRMLIEYLDHLSPEARDRALRDCATHLREPDIDMRALGRARRRWLAGRPAAPRRQTASSETKRPMKRISLKRSLTAEDMARLRKLTSRLSPLARTLTHSGNPTLWGAGPAGSTAVRAPRRRIVGKRALTAEERTRIRRMASGLGPLARST